MGGTTRKHGVSPFGRSTRCGGMQAVAWWSFLGFFPNKIWGDTAEPVASRCIVPVDVAIGVMHWVATGLRWPVVTCCIIPVAFSDWGDAAGCRRLSGVSPLNDGWVLASDLEHKNAPKASSGHDSEAWCFTTSQRNQGYSDGAHAAAACGPQRGDPLFSWCLFFIYYC